MPDATIPLTPGQAFDAYLTMEAATGNYTVTSASYSVITELGSPISGLTNVPGTILVSGPAPTVSASYFIASSSLVSGRYTATLTLIATDGATSSSKTQTIGLTIAASTAPSIATLTIAPLLAAYTVGEVVPIMATFLANGSVVDPTSVVCQVRNPLGIITSTAMVKDSTGKYYLNIQATKSGTWYYRVSSTGTAQEAKWTSFTVSHDPFNA